MRGTKIDLVEKFNFLGITIDKHLQWNNHISNLSLKLSKTIGFMNWVKHLVPRYCLKMVYYALINSHLNYGILVWGHKASEVFPYQKKSHLNDHQF